MNEDFSLCISCAFSGVCAELAGEEPVAYECEGYMNIDDRIEAFREAQEQIQERELYRQRNYPKYEEVA